METSCPWLIGLFAPLGKEGSLPCSLCGHLRDGDGGTENVSPARTGPRPSGAKLRFAACPHWCLGTGSRPSLLEKLARGREGPPPEMLAGVRSGPPA